MNIVTIYPYKNLIIHVNVYLCVKEPTVFKSYRFGKKMDFKKKKLQKKKKSLSQSCTFMNENSDV